MQERRIVIFLGAGASSIAQMPTVSTFLNSLESSWPPGAGYKAACEELVRLLWIWEGKRDVSPGLQYDAEKLIGNLTSLVNMQDLWRSPFKIRLRGQAEVEGSGLLAFLKEQIIKVYGRWGLEEMPALYEHHLRLIGLLDKRISPNDPLLVFTTNYDTLVEDSLRQPLAANMFRKAPRVCTGFADGLQRSWDPKLFDQQASPGERLVHVYKLHGCARWKRDAAGHPVDTGWSGPTGQYDCLLHFGFKGIPETEPFKTLHAKLEQAILRPTTLLTIGFRMGDPYIQKTTRMGLLANRKLRVLFCMSHEPQVESPLRGLLAEFPDRVTFLRGGDGKPVPFGDEEFLSCLETALDVSSSR